MKPALILLAPLAFAGCVTTQASVPSAGETASIYARIGETVVLGGSRVTPLVLIEDSRCPQGVQCVWAGRVRISATISTPSAKFNRELTFGEPIGVADGTLMLAAVEPGKRKEVPIRSSDYRFGLRFKGGL